MIQREFLEILVSLPSLSPEQLRRLSRELDRRLEASPEPEPNPDPSDEELQARLLAAGVIGEIKPPIRDLAPYRDRKAVPIRGEPLSETVIRERR